MRENYETLVSVGTAELLPLSAFLSPAEPRGKAGAGSYTEEGQEPPARGSPQGGQPQHSLHLTALVQLVKEIPEFLFGEIKGTEDSPESGTASLDGDRASLEAAVAVGTYPLQGLFTYLPDSPMSQPSMATTPTSSSSCSGPPGDGGQGSPFPIKTMDRPQPTRKEGPGTTNAELNTPANSPGQRKSHQRQERRTGVSTGTSPLQGLINCLTEILVPGPQHSDAVLGSVPPLPSLDTLRQTRMDLGPGSPPWPVKTEAASGDCPLQGLLNCLKEIPETQDRHPSPSRAGHPRVQEDPGPLKKNSGGSGRLQTLPHPSGPGAGGTLTVVKVEDSWTQSPPVPTSCQLSRQGHSATRDTRGVHVPGWGPEAQACRPSRSPLKALEACLKGIPTSALSPPQLPATSWSQTPHPGDAGSQRPEPQPQGSHSEDATREPLVPLGPSQSSAPRGTPTSFSSASSTDGVMDFGSPGGNQHPGKGCPPGSSPLQGLENCLREIPMPRLQPAQPCFSAEDRGLRRAESRNWMAYKEGLRSEACEPFHLGQGGREVPNQSPRLASPQAIPSSCVPACYQQGLKDQGATRPGLWRWPQDGKAEEMGGSSLSLRREVGAESACQPGLLSSATAGGTEAAAPRWPTPPPEKRPGPRASEDTRDLDPGYRRPNVSARTQGRLLPGDPPEPPSNSPAAISPAWLATSPRPPCPCGRPLQQELHSLSAALTEKLDQLATALAGLTQEVATMRTQVDQLRRRPREPGPKGPPSWLWSLPRGPRWAHSPGHKHLPYWRQKGPTRPKPKILRAQADGCRPGDPQGLSRARVPPVPQVPTDAVLTEPSRPSCSPSQHPPLGPSYPAMQTEHTLLGHTGHHQGLLPSFMSAALPSPQASPAASTDPEPLVAGDAWVRFPARPKELRGALQEELWGGEHRDPRWGAH
ncbi:protein KRBA1 isoform X7 [Fukomys damarensis]|uniref:protein KRBA1 isoform X7 n=1 Tax=Fukomys damarensis TaxID=885580 RepID=UPI00053F366F|nr:protein KRBA1 isoform X7 [Fukomys damarensis]